MADTLAKRTILIGLVLAALTALAMYLVYGPYTFSQWPWMRFSLTQATLTCLWTFAFWFGRVTGGSKNSLNPLFFALVVIPFDAMLLYPGPATLGLHSDPQIMTFLLILKVVHGFGFYGIQREIERYLRYQKAV